MACSICLHDFSQRRRAHCASCASVALYIPRLHQISSLIDKESTHAHVEAIVRPGNDGVLASLPQNADWEAIASGIKTNSICRNRQDLDVLGARLASIADQAEQLKRQMILYRDEIEARKRLATLRRSDLDKKRQELDQYKSEVYAPAETAVRRTKQKIQRLCQRSADAKANLCFTASTLLGLRQEIDLRRKVTGRIMLAGLVIPDLRELNGPSMDTTVVGSLLRGPADHSFERVNACLDSIARLAAIWTHYLTISVPAEILLPHNDFPHAGILVEKSSYRGIDVQYSGNSSQNGSPATSRIIHEIQNLPRPRILQLDRPLSKLAKEEPKAFGLFVEGVTLLAWDVAWLCRTQGIISINTFDEVCDIGRNLWLLHRAAEIRATEAATRQTEVALRPKLVSRTSQFGKLTHGTVSHSLSGHEGAAALQNWRLAQPQHLTDKLRAFLLGEMTKAEWDVLSDKDFDDPPEDEVAVLVGGTRTRRYEYDGTMSIMSVVAPDKASAGMKGEKGWMKVRDRVNDS